MENGKINVLGEKTEETFKNYADITDDEKVCECILGAYKVNTSWDNFEKVFSSLNDRDAYKLIGSYPYTEKAYEAAILDEFNKFLYDGYDIFQFWKYRECSVLDLKRAYHADKLKAIKDISRDFELDNENGVYQAFKTTRSRTYLYSEDTQPGTREQPISYSGYGPHRKYDDLPWELYIMLKTDILMSVRTMNDLKKIAARYKSVNSNRHGNSI